MERPPGFPDSLNPQEWWQWSCPMCQQGSEQGSVPWGYPVQDLTATQHQHKTQRPFLLFDLFLSKTHMEVRLCQPSFPTASPMIHHDSRLQVQMFPSFSFNLVWSTRLFVFRKLEKTSAALPPPPPRPNTTVPQWSFAVDCHPMYIN